MSEDRFNTPPDYSGRRPTKRKEPLTVTLPHTLIERMRQHKERTSISAAEQIRIAMEYWLDWQENEQQK